MENYESTENSMIKSLTCPICKNLFISPLIASCCSNTFCVMCIGNSSKCPVCKKFSGFSPNRIVNELVESLPFNCVCGKRILRRDRGAHETECEAVMRTCKKCNFVGNLNDRVVHLLEKHSEAVIAFYSEII